MAWVWKHSTAGPTERLVLLAIADCTNDAGQAWPSMAALVAKTRLSERTVQRAVAVLVDLGELAAVVGGGRGRTTRYRLTMETQETLSEKPRKAGTPSEKPRNPDQKPRQPVKETPSTTTENPVTVTPGTIRNHQGTIKEPGDTAQNLVGEWLDHCTKRPPQAVIGQVGKQLRALLGEGIDPADVRRGLALWHGKGLHPSTLPSVVNESMNGRASPLPRGYVERDGRTLKAETAANLDLIKRMEARDAQDEQAGRPAIEGRRR